MIKKFILKYLSESSIKKLIVELLREIAKNTDNTVDDVLVEMVEKALNDY